MRKKLSKSKLTQLIREKAKETGFLACGFSPAKSLTAYEQHYATWIEKKFHAEMAYMARNIDKRLNPALLVEGAQSVISFLYNYYPSETLQNTPYRIAKYAYGEDYHNVINNKLRQIDEFIKTLEDGVVQRYNVDAWPVMEKVLASNSGLGWIGKNSCLISRRHGSFVFIAEIITSLELQYDVPEKDYCGSCNKCIEACPTQAITQAHTVDSRKCISYLTIENKGYISTDFKGKFKNYIFGCDICQDVCPWNKKAQPHAEPLFNLNRTIREMNTEDWENMDEPMFRNLFDKSAIKRTKFTGFKRNIQFVRTSEM